MSAWVIFAMQMSCRVFQHVSGAKMSAYEDTEEAFKVAYDLGERLIRRHQEAGAVLPALLDGQTATGHLMRICLEQQRLSQGSAATSAEAAGGPILHGMSSPFPFYLEP